MFAIEIKNFTKKYGNFTAVKNLNLSIKKGLVIGFVGKNGAGKSTTIRSIFNMIKPTNGTISIFGMDSQRDTKKIKSKSSYIPSEAMFYDNITCLELLKFSIGFTDTSLEQIENLAEYFELDLSKKINQLSLGNRKKVSLIQGFLKNAEIIILDEPTNGLDPLMQNKFFDLVLAEKGKGKTILLSSHNLSEVEKYCDNVAIIKDGELVDYFDMSDVKIKHKQIVKYKTKNGEEKIFEAQEDINNIIAKLAKIDLLSLEISTKTVADEFIKYYGDEK